MATGQLADYAIGAYAKMGGFAEAQLPTVIAIAMAESGGVPTKHNSVPPDDSYGLMQINMIGALGPARRRTFGISSNAQLFDPETNMRAAYIVSSHGTNFSPWSTYTTTDPKVSYKRFLAEASGPHSVAAAGQPGAVVTQAAADVSGATGISAAANALGSTITKIGSNIAMVLLIVLFLAIGIMLITKTSPAKVVSDVSPLGAVAKTLSYQGKHG
jgi:hypothetical protein